MPAPIYFPTFSVAVVLCVRVPDVSPPNSPWHKLSSTNYCPSYRSIGPWAEDGSNEFISYLGKRPGMKVDSPAIWGTQYCSANQSRRVEWLCLGTNRGCEGVDSHMQFLLVWAANSRVVGKPYLTCCSSVRPERSDEDWPSENLLIKW